MNIIKFNARVDKRGFQIGEVAYIKYKKHSASASKSNGIKPAPKKQIEFKTIDSRQALEDLMSVWKWILDETNYQTKNQYPEWDEIWNKHPEFQIQVLNYCNKYGLFFDRSEFNQMEGIIFRNWFNFTRNVAIAYAMATKGDIAKLMARPSFMDAHFVLKPIMHPETLITMEFRAETLRDVLIAEVFSYARTIWRSVQCVTCGVFFEAKRSHSKYCSNKCKQKDFRNKQARRNNPKK